MKRLRSSVLRHRELAALLLALALAMKLLLPAGFMPVMSSGTMTIELCTGHGLQIAAVPIPGTHHGEGDGQSRIDMPCSFSGLATPSLAAADPIILALAIAFIVATVFRVAIVRRTIRLLDLRPPATGPPAAA